MQSRDRPESPRRNPERPNSWSIFWCPLSFPISKRTAAAAFLWFLAGCLSTPSALAQFAQQGSKLVGSGAAGPANQGSPIGISNDGNTMVMAGPSDNGGAGAIWIFTRSGGTWSQQGNKLSGTGAVGSARQGSSVALSSDGNTLIESGPADSPGPLFSDGAIWIFVRTGGVWTQQAKLAPSGGAGNPSLGVSVALSADGNTALAGGPQDNGSLGAVWVFTRSGGAWTQQAKLVGAGAVGSAALGVSVALSADGNTALAGGPQDNDSLGAIWIFTRSGGTWSQQGNKLLGAYAAGAAQQGTSVALSADGNTAVAGGDFDNGGNGAAWVFTRSGGTWSQQGNKLFGTGSLGAAGQGRSVAVSADGNTLVEGGPSDALNMGAVWIFARSGGAWGQLGSKLVGTGADSTGNLVEQGFSVAVSSDGNTVVSGAPSDAQQTGAGWVFTRALTPAAAPIGVNPASGSGSFQIFQFTFSDPDGYQSLEVVDILIRDVLDGRQACYVAFVPSGPNSGSLYLVDDAGDAGGPYTGMVLPGGGSTPSNGQCSIYGGSVSGIGNTLTLTLDLSLNNFPGNKIVYMAAGDARGNSGWQALGVWQIPFTPAGSISVLGLAPERAVLGSGTAQTLIATLKDDKGAGDFGVVNVLVNNFIDGRQACYLAYVSTTNTLLLVDDAGDGGGPFAGSMMLNGSAGTIQNGQCSVNSVGSAAGKSDNALTLTLNVTFTAGFSGNHIVWVAGRDAAGGNNTNWQAMGTLTVQP